VCVCVCVHLCAFVCMHVCACVTVHAHMYAFLLTWSLKNIFCYDSTQLVRITRQKDKKKNNEKRPVTTLLWSVKYTDCWISIVAVTELYSINNNIFHHTNILLSKWSSLWTTATELVLSGSCILSITNSCIEKDHMISTKDHNNTLLFMTIRANGVY